MLIDIDYFCRTRFDVFWHWLKYAKSHLSSSAK